MTDPHKRNVVLRAVCALLGKVRRLQAAAPCRGGLSNSTPGEQTADIVLAELKATLDKQIEAIDSLDSKAGVLFAATSVVGTLMALVYAALFQSQRPACLLLRATLSAGVLVNVGLSVGVLCCLVLAFRVVSYSLPLDPQEVEEAYLPLSPGEARKQLLANYIEYLGVNAVIIARKAKWIQRSLLLLTADIASLMILVGLATLRWLF